jgi:hypothetical protein
MKCDMPASYQGDALGGSTKPDGVNQIVKRLLERGAKMAEIQERLVKLGKAKTAARAHLMFLNKNGVELLVNGHVYIKGQRISLNDFITLN